MIKFIIENKFDLCYNWLVRGALWKNLDLFQFFNYLDHSGMSAMLEGENGDKLLELAENISVCLHEDWKSNLVREKGKDYQHFRPVKDAEFAKMVIANKDEYCHLSLKTASLYIKLTKL